MLQGKYNPMKEKGNKALVAEALEVSLSPRTGQDTSSYPPSSQYACGQLPQDKQQHQEMDKHVKSSLKNLKLDESSSIGYFTVWAYRVSTQCPPHTTCTLVNMH